MVGAGFAGADHAPVLAEAGCRVHVIDKRPHIASNAYDEMDASGVRVHRYGRTIAYTCKMVTREEPCDYRDNNLERYYPVKTSDGRYDAIYRQYKGLAESEGNLTFIGRCGTYQYLDMHQVINQSLASAHSFVASEE